MLLRLYSIFKRLSHSLWHFVGAAMLDQIMVSGVNFFVGFYLARQLGISQFGQFSLILLIIFFCLEIQRALVIAPMMTLMAKNDHPDYLPQLGYMQIFFNITASLGATAFVFASGFIFPKWHIGHLSFLTFFITFARLQQEFLRRVFFVQSHARRALILDAITFTLILLSIWFLAHSQRLTLANVLWWHVAGYLCPSFLAMTYTLHPRIKWAECLTICRDHLQFGRWLVGGTIVQFFSSNWLIMISGAILGASTVGLIKSAQYLLGGATMLFQALENVVPLRLARLYHQPDPALPRRYLRNLTAFVFIFTAAYTLVMLYLIPFMANYLKVSDYKLFYQVAVIFLCQTFLYGSVLILTYILRARSLTKAVFYTHTLTALLTITLAPAAIRIWQEMAVVYGIGIAQVVAILCFIFFIRRAPQHA